LIDVQDGTIEPVMTGLTLFGTDNERSMIGEVPKCRSAEVPNLGRE
jgi:hypothetical protein